MPNKKEIDILDLLPPEAISQVDKLGYDFLSEQGYDTEGAADLETVRKRLKKELKASGLELVYIGAINDKDGAILLWYELRNGEEKVAVSQGIKFLPKEKGEGDNGEG